ncbi:MAG: 30S ribosomal protein S12 methylthiotransferase RimO [Thermoanaerobaculum sp.]|nr:30S ribosomal protein S12 methylthiotransferase RimO [Thermoanaerobaculum sp.]
MAGRRPLKVGMISLGCAKNLVDSEVMLGFLTQRGVEVTTDPQQAEVIIVNTCGFLEEAKQESINTILEMAQLKETGRLKRLVVAGCMVQRYARELAQEIPEIDAFVGLDELERAPEAVLGQLGRDHIPDQVASVRLYDHQSPRLLATGGVYAYLKVAEGCNNPCAFCHIPRMRGAFRSRRLESAVAEAQQLRRKGVQELVLIAQDTTRYGEDLGMGRRGLYELLEALLRETDFPWIRFLYAYPATLDPAIFDLMAANPRLVPYLDIPLQHASRKVLKLMQRGGDGGSYRQLIEQARQKVPGLAVRTSFIVGFPGEGEAEFHELLRFVEEVEFDHLGVFTYSFQEENPGAHLGDPVPQEVKEARREKLLALQQRLSRRRLQVFRGREVVVLVDGASPEHPWVMQGRLATQAPEVDGAVVLSGGPVAPGEFVRVRVRTTSAYDLVGEVVEVVGGRPTNPTVRLPVAVR